MSIILIAVMVVIVGFGVLFALGVLVFLGGFRV